MKKQHTIETNIELQREYFKKRTVWTVELEKIYDRLKKVESK